MFAAETPLNDMFNVSNWEVVATGAPALVGALASFDCRVEEIHRAGTHFIFFGNVERTTLGEGIPLIYGSRSYGAPAFFDTD